MCLLLSGLITLAWGYFPPKSESLFLLNFTPDELSLPESGVEPDTKTSPLEGRLVEMIGPSSIRLGDVSEYSIRWLPEAGDACAGCEDIYASYNLVAQVRVELDGLSSEPFREIISPLRPGSPVEFSWKLRADTPGIKSGSVWLHVGFVPRREAERDDTPTWRLLAAPTVEIKVTSLLGAAGLPARIIGMVFFVIGLVLVFEARISAIITNLFVKEEKTET